MMMLFGITFMSILLSLYNIFRYILKRNGNLLFAFYWHINYTIFFLTIMLVVIYWSNLLAKEVHSNYKWFAFELSWRPRNWSFICYSGKTLSLDCAWHYKLLWWFNYGTEGNSCMWILTHIEGPGYTLGVSCVKWRFTPLKI